MRHPPGSGSGQGLPEGVAIGDPGALEALFADRDDRAWAAEPPSAAAPSRADPAALAALSQAYRDRGHLAARLDPLQPAPEPTAWPELDPATYGLDPAQVVGELAQLTRTWCGPIGFDAAHIHDRVRRQWVQAAASDPAFAAPGDEGRLAALALVARAEAFEAFMRQRFPAEKTFGLSGIEGYLVVVEALLADAAANGAERVVIAGMHRGRLNFMVNLAGQSPTALLAALKGEVVPPDLGISSDVAYHLGYDGSRVIAGRELKISVVPHPSHLELVSPVALGRCRALQRRAGDRSRVRALLLHTDASFAGQGIAAETLQLAGLPAFSVGGTVHVVANNQIGFTTGPEAARTGRFCSDVARIADAPVFRVNADEPEALLRAAGIAAAYRARFEADAVVEVIGFRRFGHNEIDEPRFTQPELYRRIDAHPGARARFQDKLAAAGLDTDAAERAAAAMTQDLDAALKASSGTKVNRADWLSGAWAGLQPAGPENLAADADSGVPVETLHRLGAVITDVPPGLQPHDKVHRFLNDRRRTIETGSGITWATAEALALASLLDEGRSVRLGGQDTPRGAFTQRHLILADQASGAAHCVLDAAARPPAAAEVFNTPLMEYAVLAFEYGHTVADPDTLVVWEAQFGDFLNVAQPVVDQMICCSEDRWLRMSGLVLLLPHGLDGGGPDHATAHPERLLAACAEGNMQVANPSTPANYFHLLRRQQVLPFRKPLAVLAPKMLLRHRACVSDLAEMDAGTGFRPVIGDGPSAGARRLVLCSGKVAYELAEARRREALDAAVTLLRLERLYPFPAQAVADALACHPDAALVFCQEEPANMGPYGFVQAQLAGVTDRPVAYAGRRARPTPAVSRPDGHADEREALLAAALFGPSAASQ